MQRTTLLLYLVLAAFFALPAMAQNTGKIAGTVEETGTGEPLAGVNVMVEGLPGIGAATGVEGDFFILQVPPGTYTVTASYIGFQTVRVEEVVVRSDLTTTLDIEMEAATYEGDEVVVTAEDPLVQRDLTSTRRTQTREEMERAPGMEQALDVFRTTGAVVGTPSPPISLDGGTRLEVRDQSVADIHVRGGRGGEILFLVDGMPVSHPLYGGRAVLDLNVNDIEQVELLTGAFSAEYGQAQSGVVNITTRGGSQTFEGGVEYRTDALTGSLGEHYNEDYVSLFVGGPLSFTKTLGLPGEASFFLSGSATQTDTPYDNGRTRHDLGVVGLSVPERQDNSGSVNARVDWRASAAARINLSYNGSWKRWSNFDWLWRDYPDNTAIHERQNHHLAGRFTHTLSPATFYEVRLGYLDVGYQASLDGTRPPAFWEFYPEGGGDSLSYQGWLDAGQPALQSVEPIITPPTADPLTGFFTDRGAENLWRDDATSTFTLKADITSQVHPSHLVKTGIEIQHHRLSYVDIQDGGVALSPWGQVAFLGADADSLGVTQPPGPFPEFGANRWVFDATPTVGGAYVQDKFELSSLIINAGVRADFFSPGGSVFEAGYQEVWERATGQKADYNRWRMALAPRLGLSFPINTKTVLFFSYGHFYQLPELQFYYRDPYTGGFTGNPHLDYVQTILYEFGFTRQFGTTWAADVKTYAKDISQQVGTTFIQPQGFGFGVNLYDNNGYARARGVEFSLEKRRARYLSGNVTYTAQWANGYASSAFEDFIRSQTDLPNPIRERRLSWDVRHQFVFTGSLGAGPDQHPELFGLKLPSDWDITVLSRLSSGYPYTPYTTDPAELQKLENTETGPPIYSTDIKVRKGFSFGNDLRGAFYVDVFNVLNQQNTQIAFGFNPYTGEPYIYGDFNLDTIGLEEQRGLDYYDIVRIQDPRRFSTGRYAKLGLSLTF